jgi:catechol 2,3-dioxygenase-like lactoylglutathione lyase family enzyme
MYEAVDNIGIAVTDIDEAIEFYETLGFDVERYSEQDAQVTPTEDSAYFYVFESTADGPSADRDSDLFSNPVGIDHVSIRVDDVDETYNELSREGVEFMFQPTTDDDWGLRMTAVQDPSDNIIYFIKYV